MFGYHFICWSCLPAKNPHTDNSPQTNHSPCTNSSNGISNLSCFRINTDDFLFTGTHYHATITNVIFVILKLTLSTSHRSVSISFLQGKVEETTATNRCSIWTKYKAMEKEIKVFAEGSKILQSYYEVFWNHK